MTGQPIVTFSSVSKEFGDTVAVRDVSFEVRPGRVVGLLGRNGAGKTTCLRMLMGLSRPTSGTATVFGRPYDRLPRAARRIGVSMEGIGPVGGVTSRRDLRIWARSLGVANARVDEVIEQVGLAGAAGQRIKDFSTGMRQRHALATALLGEPELLILDEPANGLDPDGIRWLRDLLRGVAAQGRTVLLSSHLLAEIEQTVDEVLILQQSLRYHGALDDLTDGGERRLEERFFDLVGSSPAIPARHAAATGGGGHA